MVSGQFFCTTRDFGATGRSKLPNLRIIANFCRTKRLESTLLYAAYSSVVTL